MNQLKYTNRKNWCLIDFFKLICALLIVELHCVDTIGSNSVALTISKCFALQAVPFFIIVSGFLLNEKINKGDDIAKSSLQSAKKWGLLYLCWSVLWLPTLINVYINKYPDASIVYLVFLLIRSVFFSGQGVYWYLWVVTETVLIFCFFKSKGKMNFFYIIGIIGLVLGFIYDYNIQILGFNMVNKIFYIIFGWSNNVIMKGIPFFAIGCFISQYYKYWNLNKSLLVIFYTVVSIVMVVQFNQGHMQWLAFCSIQAVCMMLFAIQSNNICISKSTSLFCRKMSSAIYLLHSVILYGIVDNFISADESILLKFILTTGGCMLIYWLVNHSSCRRLKWLIGIE